MIIAKFQSILGSKYVLTEQHTKKAYCTGFRSGTGSAMTVLLPGTLVEFWRCLKVAIANNVAVIVQGANTGLTEGSTPSSGYDREITVISTRRLQKIVYLEKTQQVICMAGSTLYDLETLLASKHKEPHSVIGSSCIGASVIGGVCNNSGGALVERGPAYTELALFAQVTPDGQLTLINKLGVELGEDPEEILKNLETATFDQAKIYNNDYIASDTGYSKRVRLIDEFSPARYNANPQQLKDASGCAGKLAVFAVRLDTFTPPKETKTFFISSQSERSFSDLRRNILQNCATLPISAEYMHRDIFLLTETYGRDLIFMIRAFGTKALPYFFRWKKYLSARFGNALFSVDDFLERLIFYISRLTPIALPPKFRKLGRQYEHHLILKAKDDGIKEIEALLVQLENKGDIHFLSCSEKEDRLIHLHRFGSANAAIKYQQIHKKDVGESLSLDIALPRNTTEWVEQLPPSISQTLVKKLYYGHFLCYVFHQDYILKQGVSPEQVKEAMLELLEKRGAKYPAEHNVGQQYDAEPVVKEHYKHLDPNNVFNPGVGKMSKLYRYK